MLKIIIFIFFLLPISNVLYCQGVLEPHSYLKEGVIEHHGATATVKADCARPLQQAITAVREEYGWAVDYEDPPYQSKYDLTDMTNPKYRAANPNAPVVLGPSGGAFQSTYPESPNIWSSPALEREVLEKIVSDYNRSGNPGNFVVRSLPNGTFDIVGNSIRNDKGVKVPVNPILDTPILIPRSARSLDGAITAILQALSTKTGFDTGIGLGPTNLLMSPAATTTVGGASAPARDLLKEVTARMKQYVVLFLYEPDQRQYLLGLLPVVRAQYDTFGQKRLVPVGHLIPH